MIVTSIHLTAKTKDERRMDGDSKQEVVGI
jgi:hypothetical protein